MQDHNIINYDSTYYSTIIFYELIFKIIIYYIYDNKIMNILRRMNFIMDEINYLNEKLSSDERKVIYKSASPKYSPKEEMGKLQEEEELLKRKIYFDVMDCILGICKEDDKSNVIDQMIMYYKTNINKSKNSLKNLLEKNKCIVYENTPDIMKEMLLEKYTGKDSHKKEYIFYPKEDELNKLKAKYWLDDVDEILELLKNNKISEEKHVGYIGHPSLNKKFEGFMKEELCNIDSLHDISGVQFKGAMVGNPITGEYSYINNEKPDLSSIEFDYNQLYNGGNLPIIYARFPEFMNDTSYNIKEDESQSSFSKCHKLWLKGVRNPIYDFDNTSMYSKVQISYNVLHNNVHISLKPKQIVFMIYGDLIFKISGNNKIDFECTTGNLDINGVYYKTFDYFFITQPQLNRPRQTAVITYEQYRLLRKSTKELFPSIETFGRGFIKDINDSISCVYKHAMNNEVYLYTYNHSNYNKPEDVITIDSLRDMCPKITYGMNNDSPFVRKGDGTYRIKRLDEIVHDELNRKDYNADRIIESKQKKPIYSKRRC